MTKPTQLLVKNVKKVYKFNPKNFPNGFQFEDAADYPNEVLTSSQNILNDTMAQVFFAVVGSVLYLIFTSQSTTGGRTMKKRSNKRHNKTYKHKQ